MSVTKSAVVLTAALLMAAGCGSTGSSGAAGAPSTPPATSDTGSAPSTPTSSPTTTTTTTTKTSGASGQGAGTARCHSADLKIVWKVDPGGGAAGSQGSYLIFTNTSGRTCTLYGFPGVSFVAGDQGTQVGSAFQRNEGTKKKTVSVAPGKTAYSQLVLVNASVFDKADCKAVQARGFRVYPPEETAAVFVSQSQTACSLPGKGVGVVWPIVAGSPAT
jgi:hypothetical protein